MRGVRLSTGDRVREKATGRTGTVRETVVEIPGERRAVRVAFDDRGPDLWLVADEVHVIREPAAGVKR